MLFNSLEFAVFLVACYALYLVLPHRGQNRLLLVASYVFYGFWDWRFLSLIFLSTVIDSVVARNIAATDEPGRRKRWLVLSVATNLGLLGFFKYAGFFAASLRALFLRFDVELPEFALNVVLPVGISFYTFQTLSYTIDVYRRKLEPTRDFLDFALFVSFFPQLVAGPIERASRLLPQIVGPRHASLEQFGRGCWLILWGTFKKVVIADNLAGLVNAVYTPGVDPTGPEVVLATWAFAFQIYCDFSGYTDVARGVARLFGFELMLNFDLPYLATSPADFWRRWHISLSTWLRDYLYISLGGNRGSGLLTYRNLCLTMLLGGLWHGAAWTFVFWGAYQGLLLVVHRLARPWLERIRPTTKLGRGAWWSLRVAVMFQLVCLGWMIFRAESITDVGRLLSAIVHEPHLGLSLSWLRPFLFLLLPLALMQAAQARSRDLEVVFRLAVPLRAVVYAGLFLAIVVFGEDFGEPFLYFQF